MTHSPTSKCHAVAWHFSFLLFSVLVISSCYNVDSTEKTSTQLIIPVQLESDSTRIALGDFHAWIGHVDSVLWENGEPISIHRDLDGLNETVAITKQPLYSVGYLQLWSSGKSIEIPLLKTTKKKVTVRLERTAEIQDASIMGSFTAWQSSPIPLKQIGSSLAVELNLEKGSHLYQFVSNGQEFPDPNNASRVANGFGGFNSILEVRGIDKPLELTTAFQDSIHCTSAPSSHCLVFWDNTLVVSGKTDSLGALSFAIPAVASEHERSHLRIWVANEAELGQHALIPLKHGIPIQNTDELTRQDRQTMIMYFLMVDRFKNGNVQNDWKSNDPGVQANANHYGGDLKGVLQALPYLDSLGINTVWVSPITPNPDDAWGFWSDPSTDITSKFSGYHGYWPIASTGIDRRFGTMKLFDSLVNEVHAKDMNILIDYVANHVHQDHPVYLAHPDWVTNLYLPNGDLNTQLWDSQRLTTWFDTFMPTLDLQRKEVYETMTDSALWWVKNTQIDGFRHDATKHIPEVFWRQLTAKVRAQTTGSNRSLFQIGETYGAPSLIKKYVASGMLDAQFDFNLYDAMVAVFAADEPDLSALIAISEQSLRAYGAHHLMGNITGNQDRPRFASLADGGLIPGEDTKLAGWTREIVHSGQRGYTRMGWLMASIMSHAGIPCIYYGDEIADVGGNDPDNRRMMRFDDWNRDEQALWNWTHKWIELRKSRMSLMYGQSAIFIPEKAAGVLAIERTYLGEKTVTYINTSNQHKTVSLPKQSSLSLLLGMAEFEGSTVTLEPNACAAFDVNASL